MPIRPATPADVPAVLPMVRAICAMHEQLDPDRFAMLPDVVDRYARWLPERAVDPRSVFLVAEDRGVVVGFLIATVEASIPIYRLKEFGFIHDVWVEPGFRGHGIGERLIDEAVRRFRLMGVEQVRLEVADANDGARRLFDTCGFRAATTEMLRQIAPAGESATPGIFLHVTTSDAWELAQARGSYTHKSLYTEGFIHGSTRAQVAGTLARHFAGQTGLVALVIDGTRLTSVLKWEDVRGERYPHVFGPIDLDAVVDVEPIPDQR